MSHRLSRAVQPTGAAQPAASAEVQPIVDRERSSPWLRWVNYFGAPVGVSLIVHLVLIAGLGITGWVVSQHLKPAANEYEGGLTRISDQMGAAFAWPGEGALGEADPADKDLAGFEIGADVGFSTADFLSADGLGDASSGFGLGDGEQTGALGIGSGHGGAGSGIDVGSGPRGAARISFARQPIEAHTIVYVIDYSGSVLVARDELVRALKKSVSELHERQGFNVIIFYSRNTESGPKMMTESFGQALRSAGVEVKRKFYEWIAEKTPQGSTEPLEAMKRALSQAPEAICFMSDGCFDDRVVDEIRNANRGKTKLVCLVFDEVMLQRGVRDVPERLTDGARRMKRIAEENNGTVKVVTLEDLE